MATLRAVARRAAGLSVLALLGACVSATPSASETPSASYPATTSATPSSSVEPSLTAFGWRALTAQGNAPPPREDHTWTADGAGRIAYLFGGRDSAGYGAYGDLWAYELTTNTWRQLSAIGPAPRFGHNAVWVNGVGLVIFAGQGGTTFFNDLWAYDPGGNAWRQLPSGGSRPVSRYGSCAALGPDGRLWISHGFTSEGSRFADTRAYDFATATWTDETPAGDAPVERCLHACWWTDDGRFTLYAGQTTGATALDDLWELTIGPRPGANAWIETSPDKEDVPPARNLYASTRSGTYVSYIFGGQGISGGYLNDLWMFGDAVLGGMAISVDGTLPVPRAGAELVADEAYGRLLLFGGRDSATHFNDLWELTLP